MTPFFTSLEHDLKSVIQYNKIKVGTTNRFILSPIYLIAFLFLSAISSNALFFTDTRGYTVKRKILIVFVLLSIAISQFLYFEVGCFDVYAWNKAVIGDVNADGVVNISDYVLMKRYILRIIADFPADDDMWVGDVNGDNVINDIDCNYLKRYLLHMIREFPKNSYNSAPTFTPIPTFTPTPTPTKAPAAPANTQSGILNDGYFPPGTSKHELIARASSLKVSEVKAIIKKQVDEHWDVIRDVCGFKNKEVAYAFFFGMATRESTFRAATETGSGASHAFGPLQTAETAYANANPNYMPEHNVPEMHQYDFTEYNFYDVGISVHMGIRHFLHFARLAKEKYSGRDIARHGLMGYNTGWIDGADESWIVRYADETAALGAWYLRNNHMSDDEFTWDTDPRVDRSNPWEIYY
ncbi:MAG TPA: dockerin [Hungateiclostridium thermocellum]|uniref:Dockerin type I repeat protein n=1 Tax=Acetivibrio thermocellus AD2 TaxID=1138384 RepID=A0AB36TGV6_ACETH|nr:Dockerin type 1 [Acetivibrio thermocellus DSM 1313]ALX08796.1 Dockerin type 1 protein [Acetivibrio thermocellus AD2]ANV76547.1 Dockerin type 1 protein [Acetivibrio thermocellus DSM 2360]EIC05204.1 Dockerin type 1 protein [Acetivibrio thermocellus YS]NLU27138.1 dockerin [Acetivibrio thermocellus]CDG35149.1 cellulosome protein dockerin type I [Acetivibrio thermocellus BC1]